MRINIPLKTPRKVLSKYAAKSLSSHNDPIKACHKLKREIKNMQIVLYFSNEVK